MISGVLLQAGVPDIQSKGTRQSSVKALSAAVGALQKQLDATLAAQRTAENRILILEEQLKAHGLKPITERPSWLNRVLSEGEAGLLEELAKDEER